MQNPVYAVSMQFTTQMAMRPGQIGQQSSLLPIVLYIDVDSGQLVYL